MPTRNRVPFLEHLFASIHSQTFQNHEVIVVDDGSTDGTWDYISAYPDQLITVRGAGVGPGQARNLGASSANGKYLAFLDSDDLWFPWTLETYAAAITAKDEPAFVTGRPVRFAGEATDIDVSEEALSYEVFSDYLDSSDEWRWWGASSFVVRADVFRAVGGFAAENINAEDADLALKLGTAQGYVHVNSPRTFAYRMHEGNLTGNFDKTLKGVQHLVAAESSGRYPGGRVRARERREIITRHIRPAILECLRRNEFRAAWRLYADTFGWHVELRRWKFLLGFWARAMARSA